MARKLTKEELLKIELGDFYELADDTVREKALAKIHKKYKAAGQAKAARTTRTTGKAARAACDSPTQKKRPGRPRTNPKFSKVWALRVTDDEKFMIKHILDYTRRTDENYFAIRVLGEPDMEELQMNTYARVYRLGKNGKFIKDDV